MRLLYPFVLLLLVFSVQAQEKNADEKAIRAVINNLVKGMKISDSTLVRSCFDASARLQSVSYNTSKNEWKLTTENSIMPFLKAIAQSKTKLWEERIEPNFVIFIDHGLATTQVKYKFFLGNDFSHCGTNAFHLFKSPVGWKILQITDTRLKNCN